MEWWQWLILVAILGMAGVWFLYRKKTYGSVSGNKPPQKGIIK
jgi:hypothetical protein